MATITASAAGGAWSSTAAWEGAKVPTAADDVVLGASSGSITVSAAAVCRSLEAVAYKKTLTLNAGISIGTTTVNAASKAFTLGAGMTFAASGGKLTFVSTSTTSVGIKTAGFKMPECIFNGVGGKWHLEDKWESLTLTTGPVELLAGELATSGNECIWSSFLTKGTATRVLTLGTSVLKMTGTTNTTGWRISTITGLTFTSGTSVIELTGTGAAQKEFLGGALTYTTVIIAAENVVIAGANQFKFLQLNTAGFANATLFAQGVKQKTRFLRANGSEGSIVKIASTLAGKQASLAIEGGSSPRFVSLDYAEIKDSKPEVSTAEWFAGAHSTDGGGNTGWRFEGVPYLTTGVLDNFNRANGVLGANWSQTPGYNPLEIESEKLKPEFEGGESAQYFSRESFGASQEVYLPITLGNHEVQLWGRISVASEKVTAYVAIARGTNVYLYKVVESVFTLLEVVGEAFTWQAGDIFGLRIVGSTLRALHKHGNEPMQVACEVTDTSITGGGFVGIEIEGTGRGDEFSGGRVINAQGLGAAQGQSANARLGVGIAPAAGQGQSIAAPSKGVSRTLSQSQGQAISMSGPVESKTIPQSLTATQGQSTSATAAVARALPASQPQSAGAALAGARRLSVAQTQTPARTTSTARALALAQPQVATCIATDARAFSSTQPQGTSLTRSISRVFSIAQGQTTSQRRSLAVTYTLAQGQSATLPKLTARTCSSAQAQGSSSTRALVRTCSSVQAQASALAVSPARALASSQAQSTTLARATAASFIVSQPQASTCAVALAHRLGCSEVSAASLAALNARTVVLATTQLQSPARIAAVIRLLVQSQASAATSLRGSAHTETLNASQASSASNAKSGVRALVLSQGQIVVRSAEASRALICPQPQAPGYRAAVARAFSIAQAQSPTSLHGRSVLQGLTASQGQNASIAAGAGHGLGSAQAQSTTMARSPARACRILVGQRPELARAPQRQLPLGQPSAPSLSSASSGEHAFALTQGSSVALRRGAVRALVLVQQQSIDVTFVTTELVLIAGKLCLSTTSATLTSGVTDPGDSSSVDSRALLSSVESDEASSTEQPFQLESSVD